MLKAALAVGLLLACLWGAKHMEIEEIVRLFPQSDILLQSPKAEKVDKKECPCRLAKESCIVDNKRIFVGQCEVLWEQCSAKKEIKNSWKACTMAKRRCEDKTDGWCLDIWEKCEQEMKDHAEEDIEKKQIAPSSPWACKRAKMRCMNNGEKVFEGRCGFVWDKCAEELKSDVAQPDAAHPDSIKEAEKDIDTKDCYFDKECHDLVDWAKIGKVKNGILSRMKFAQNDEAKMNQIMARSRQFFKEAGMPEDRIDYILEKWAKSVATDTKDCYFDKTCHHLVDWVKIAKAKEGIMTRMKMSQGDDAKLKMIMERSHQIFKDAGMPEDRIDYILEKWAKSVEGDNKEVDTKDCYFDKECHMLVDWKKIGDLKQGIMSNLKLAHADRTKTHEILVNAHELFKDAGMPEERIDYILEKWARYVDQGPKPHTHEWRACKSARTECYTDGRKVYWGRCKILWDKCKIEVQKQEEKRQASWDSPKPVPAIRKRH